MLICEYDTCIVVLANMSATPQKLYSQQCSFQILSTFLYDIYVGHWPADTVWWQAKVSAYINNYVIKFYISSYIFDNMSLHRSKMNQIMFRII